MNKSLYVRITEFVTLGVTLILVLFGIVMVELQHSHITRDIHNRMQYIAWQLIELNLYSKPTIQMKQDFLGLQKHDHDELKNFTDALIIKKHVQRPQEAVHHLIELLPDGTFLELIAPPHLVRESTNELIINIIIAISIFLLLFRIIFVAYLKRLFDPLQHLVDFCKNPEISKLYNPLLETSHEIKELAIALERLMEHNRHLDEQKQHIFKEAAHEIKSPIAILKARLALFKQDTKASKETFIQETQADIEHITQKLKEVLFLKEIQWDMQRKKESFNIASQCTLMQEMFAPIFEKKSLRMESSIDEHVHLFVHKGAFSKLMQAIFENIFFHSKNNSTIYVDLNAQTLTLTIKNRIGSKIDETLFSSSIGVQMIQRLTKALGYTYQALIEEDTYITLLTFTPETFHEPLN